MKNLKRIRLSRNLSQSDLSEVAEVKLVNIQHYETGVRNINKAQVDNVYKLSLALNCSIEDLIEKEDIE